MAEPLNEFEPPTFADWRKLVDRDLAGAPFERRLVKRVAGLAVQPLYTQADVQQGEPAPPGFPPYLRGSGVLGSRAQAPRAGSDAEDSGASWGVCQEISCADLAAATRSVSEALRGGVTWLSFQFDADAVAPVAATGQQAAGQHTAEQGVSDAGALGLQELTQIWSAVPLAEVGIELHAGSAALPVAACLVAHAEGRQVPLTHLRGCLGADPLGVLAKSGALPTSLAGAYDEAAALARFAAREAPGLRALRVNTSPYHEAGADAAHELAIGLSTGLAYLRELTARGVSLEHAAQQLAFEFSVATDFFLEIAKLRAARVIWSKLVAACGGGAEAQAPFIHARTSRRTFTQRDTWVNLLRGTSESFAAVAGCADVVTTATLTEALGESDTRGARLARNTQHLLRHEAHAARVIDPAGGSYYVEALTDALARDAWAKFQQLERSGGMAQVVVSGEIQAQLAALLQVERSAVATRRAAIIGVSEFAEPPATQPPATTTAIPATSSARPAQAAASARAAAGALQLDRKQLFEGVQQAVTQGASLSAARAALVHGEPVSAEPLARERLAQPFETLRDRADQLTQQRGRPPRVFLANLGPIPVHKARAGFTQNYFEAGGFAVLSNSGFERAEEAAEAFAQSAAEVVVICSSDAVYAELAQVTARALRERGAQIVVLAGAPGTSEAAYREAGITDFIFLGANVVQSLSSLLDRVEVARW